MVLLSDVPYPLIRVTYGGRDEFRGSEDIDAEQFIAVKGFKAKGKRLSTWQIESIEELEPVRQPEEEMTDDEPVSNGDDETEEVASNETDDTSEPENLDPDAGKSQQQIIDEMTGQLSFDF
jgi:topoisomerase-4 subunit A